MLFRSFAVLCMLALALEAKMQNITVKVGGLSLIVDL